MPTFCRHGRFIERCRICSKDLPGQDAAGGRAARSSRSPARSRGSAPGAARRSAQSGAGRAAGLRVRRELREQDDGYRSELAPGLRASADARRLAQEIGFASGRLLGLAADPPGRYGQARAWGAGDREQATWICLLSAYLCPLADADPWAGIRAALARLPLPGAGSPELPADALEGIPLGPRSSHDPARGSETLTAYLQCVARAGGSQAVAITGDPEWSAERRFERIFERLALPGLGRGARYDLLVVLGRLELYPLDPASLELGGARAAAAEDLTTAAAKRVFGIAEPLLLERRARELADAAGAPLESLDLALWNWVAPERATLGFPEQDADATSSALAEGALGV
jgi:hypothetical protein